VAPELNEIRGRSEEDRQKLIEGISKAWAAIPQSYFDALWRNMRKRCEAVIAAKGWHTRY
jgi:hypothetical protein